MTRKYDPAESLRRVEAGELPLAAISRLEEMREGHLFTSTLRPPEQALARWAGLDPIGQVMGACFYQVGWQWNPTWQAGEQQTVTRALEEVRRRALARLGEEARLLGAQVVVGVEITSRGSEGSFERLEFTASGTAMRVRGAPPSEEPALALMDADGLYKCRVAGFWPVGIAMGNCIAFDPHCDCQRDTSWRNTELSGHSRLCAMVESRAIERFQQDADSHGADGVVGVTVHRSGHDHHHEGHTEYRYELLLMGTSVRKVPPLVVESPLVMIDLSRDAHRPKRTPPASGH